MAKQKRGNGRQSGVPQAADEEVGKQIRNLLRGSGALGIEPARDPVHGAEQRKGQQLRITGGELAALDAVLEQPADAALELIAAGDDGLEMGRRQRLEIEKQRRAVELVEDRVDKRGDQLPQLLVRSDLAPGDRVEQLGQSVERVLMTGKQNLFLVAEIVIEVSLLHLQRRRDLLDGRPVIAKTAKRSRRRFENVDACRRRGATVARTPAAPAT